MLSPCRLAVVALLALCGWMAASVSGHFSTTFDEIAHLAAGQSYWTRADFRLQPENGNFPQRWAALPLLASSPTLPPTNDPDWQKGDVWGVGFQYFYTLGNHPAAMLAAGRAMITLLGVALAAVVYAWSRSLFGRTGAFVSLVLAVFCPNLIAHAGLATSDLAAALAFVLALLTWWRLLHRVTVGRVLAAGGALGLLALAKFSCVLFAPVAVVLVIARLLRRAPLPVTLGRWHRWLRGPARMGAVTGGGGAALALAVIIIWAGYDFRFAMLAPDAAPGAAPAFSWDEVLMTVPRSSDFAMADGQPAPVAEIPRPGGLQAGVRFARDHRLLPEAWLYGLASVDLFSRQRLEYFAGEYRTTGWWEFFPTAFLLKTTLPALGLLLFAMFAPLWGPLAPRRRLAWRLTPLLVFLAVYWAFALASPLNIGHRHLLPTYPVLYILLGAVGWAAMRAPQGRRWLGTAVVLLLAWHMGESLRARPNYLAYFNELIGNPDNAHRYLVDSSLDWGQDLPGLKDWLSTHATGQKVFLSYFGSGDTMDEGIKATRVADNDFDRREPRLALPVMTGGVWCLSATMLHRTYTHVRGPWSADYEREYQRLVTWLHFVNTLPKGAPPTDTDGSPLPAGELQNRLVNLEHLRFGRLCVLLQLRKPDAVIGHSILIYRLNDADINLALGAPLNVLATAALKQGGR